MNQYHNFSIPMIQSDQPYGNEALTQGLMGGFNQLGAMAFQRQQKQQEMADVIQQLQIKSYLEQDMNKRVFQSNIEMMKGAGLFGDSGQGQPMGAPSVQLGGGFPSAPFANNIQPPQAPIQPPQADPAMFLRKPSFQIDPMTGKVAMTISEVENPYFRQKMDIEKIKLSEAAKGPGADSGRVALATESIKNIKDIKKILFPDGTAESFKRTTAFASNLPMGSLPIFPSRGWGKSEQEVFRKMGAALSGRQLIQTGVAARPEETQRLISQFAPSLGSNPEAAFNALTELEAFYNDYLQRTDPERRLGSNYGQQQDNSLDSIPSVGSMFNGEKVLNIRKIK